MSTLTISQQKAIADYLEGRHIPAGLGSKDAACSIAAINIALTGKLTDRIHPCMSEVIGMWARTVQDAMPDEMRNSAKWRSLLPLAAGTGREHEQERLTIILDWVWETVLPSVQPVADELGFGPQWREMCVLRSAEASLAAREAAGKAAIPGLAAITAGKAARSAWTALQMSRAAGAAEEAAEAARAALAAITAAASQASRTAGAATAAIAEAAVSQVSQTPQASRMETAARETARATARSKARSETWERFDPVGLLERLITCTDSHQSRKQKHA